MADQIKKDDDTKLIVYGALWCPDCRRAKDFLGAHRIPYEWLDLEAKPEAVAEVERLNDGKRVIPTIVFPDGRHLAEPSNDELADALELSREAEGSQYDLVIVGGGPTGLTTAIYAARENLNVLIVEASAPGGQAGVTERLDNYPGFPEGISGRELAQRFTDQALRYDVEILQAVRVESIDTSGPQTRVTLSTGAVVQAKAVLIATGSRYRRTDAKGESDLIGAGIHFCATCDGPFYKGAAEVVVIGGGNSGLEEGLFLTQFADHVTVVEFSDTLKASRLLQSKVADHPKMDVRLSTEVTEFIGDGGKLSAVATRDRKTDETGEIKASGAFVFIGLDPNTAFVKDQIDLDEAGFITTDNTFQTNVPGVFAGGDVRAGSTKQLASAVGEGAAAAIQIRYFIDSLADPADEDE
jgi:thioredoxin reductase (NADPH)